MVYNTTVIAAYNDFSLIDQVKFSVNLNTVRESPFSAVSIIADIAICSAALKTCKIVLKNWIFWPLPPNFMELFTKLYYIVQIQSVRFCHPLKEPHSLGTHCDNKTLRLPVLYLVDGTLVLSPFYITISTFTSVRSSGGVRRRPVPSHFKFPIPAVDSQNVSNESCLACAQSEKYSFGFTLRPLGS